MSLAILTQIVVSGLLIGLIYALIAAGLSLIFGLMDVVNFAHGEFLMLAMYASFGLYLTTRLDPLLMMPAIGLLMFVFGVVVYRLIIKRALTSRTNAGLVQIFATFGLAILLRGLVQLAASPEYRSIRDSFVAGHTLSLAGI
jgi:branched-chain amino acid transport system permease protein